MTLLNDKDPSVLLNVIKTITNCAEDYRGRFQLNACLMRVCDFSDLIIVLANELLLKMEEVRDEAANAQISQAAEIALATIQWRP